MLNVYEVWLHQPHDQTRVYVLVKYAIYIYTVLLRVLSKSVITSDAINAITTNHIYVLIDSSLLTYRKYIDGVVILKE